MKDNSAEKSAYQAYLDSQNAAWVCASDVAWASQDTTKFLNQQKHED